MHSYILIHTESGRAGQVATDVRALKGVERADCVTGAYEVIAKASAQSLDALAELVEQGIHPIPGVLRTLTCPMTPHHNLWEEHLEPAYAMG